MNKLPTEILNQIFILLDQQDKIECLAVCWEWNQTIEKLGLFQTIHIGSSAQFCKLVEKIKNTETTDFSKSIYSLIFDIHFDSTLGLDDVLEYFPNLQEFISFKTGGTYGRYFEYYPPQVYHPLNRIQYINATCEVIDCMRTLELGICSNLTILSLLSQNDDYLSDWTGLLENAPVLKTLSMYGFIFELVDLEDLHNVLPVLNSLMLTSNHILFALPSLSEIKPAMSIISLYIESSIYDAGDQRRLFEYVALKYPCLTDFGCNSMVIDLEETRIEGVFEDGFSSILDTTKSRLTKLTLDLDAIDPSLIDILVDSDCRIIDFELNGSKVFPVIESLARSEKAKFIQKLVSKTCYSNDSIKLKELTQFTQLKDLCLEHVEANSNSSLINLNELFHFLGDRLETLKLGHFHIVFDGENPKTENREQEYKLTSLSFARAILSSQTYDFINQYLINVRSLKFEHCNLANLSSLSLSNINLSILEIIEPIPDNKKILVKTLNNNQQRSYTSKPILKNDFTFVKRFNFNDHDVFPAVRSFPFDKFTDEPLITIECNSVQKVSLINDWQY